MVKPNSISRFICCMRCEESTATDKNGSHKQLGLSSPSYPIIFVVSDAVVNTLNSFVDAFLSNWERPRPARTLSLEALHEQMVARHQTVFIRSRSSSPSNNDGNNQQHGHGKLESKTTLEIRIILHQIIPRPLC